MRNVKVPSKLRNYLIGDYSMYLENKKGKKMVIGNPYQINIGSGIRFYLECY